MTMASSGMFVTLPAGSPTASDRQTLGASSLLQPQVDGSRLRGPGRLRWLTRTAALLVPVRLGASPPIRPEAETRAQPPTALFCRAAAGCRFGDALPGCGRPGLPHLPRPWRDAWKRSSLLRRANERGLSDSSEGPTGRHCIAAPLSPPPCGTPRNTTENVVRKRTPEREHGGKGRNGIGYYGPLDRGSGESSRERSGIAQATCCVFPGRSSARRSAGRSRGACRRAAPGSGPHLGRSGRRGPSGFEPPNLRRELAGVPLRGPDRRPALREPLLHDLRVQRLHLSIEPRGLRYVSDRDPGAYLDLPPCRPRPAGYGCSVGTSNP
jgi:hypothetical protein